jgi:hypothetical protein
MRNFLLALTLIAALTLVAGCSSPDQGSREFIPGKGWVPA